jgi:hypothetical protein
MMYFLDARISTLTSRIFLGMVLAQDVRRTASKWFRAARIGKDFKLAYKHIASVGRESEAMSSELLTTIQNHPASAGDKIVIAIDDTMTKRRGPCVQGAGIHHNATPGPAGNRLEYGHIFVTAALILKHLVHGTIGLPLCAKLYVRKKDILKIPAKYGWQFQTKLALAVAILQWLSKWLQTQGKAVWIVADGGYAKKEIIDACQKFGFTLISRLRKDAALFDVPETPKKKGRGRPRIYGENKIDLPKRAAHAKGWKTETMTLYGKKVEKKYKDFLATWKPASGVIRVVLVKEEDKWLAFFSTNLDATVAEILGAVADRNAIEQVFKDVKEVWGAGKQQLRDIHANIGAFHMNLWMMTLTELWAWDQPEEELVDRSDRPWDNKPRRPSHNDRRKSLYRNILREEFRSLQQTMPNDEKFKEVCDLMLALAA